MARPEADTDAQPRDVIRMRQRLDDWRKAHPRGIAFPEKI
jgi:hypothetical protein